MKSTSHNSMKTKMMTRPMMRKNASMNDRLKPRRRVPQIRISSLLSARLCRRWRVLRRKMTQMRKKRRIRPIWALTCRTSVISRLLKTSLSKTSNLSATRVPKTLTWKTKWRKIAVQMTKMMIIPRMKHNLTQAIRKTRPWISSLLRSTTFNSRCKTKKAKNKRTTSTPMMTTSKSSRNRIRIRIRKI